MKICAILCGVASITTSVGAFGLKSTVPRHAPSASKTRLFGKGDALIAWSVLTDKSRGTGITSRVASPENQGLLPTVTSALEPVTAWTTKAAQSVKTQFDQTPVGAAAASLSAAVVPAAGFFVGREVRSVVGLCCFVPPLLGLWKREYTVSYGYGLAMGLTGSAFLLQANPLNSFAQVHALVLATYGARLTAMLLYRELFIQHFKDVREKIEKKAPPRRALRLPFILGCGALYACMASPLVLTARHADKLVAGSLAFDVATGLKWAMVAAALVATVGDVQKTLAKHFAPPGKDVLVDWGAFYFLRHPNYTGEQVMWTCSAALGVLAALAGGPGQALPWLLSSIAGAAGIFGVLFQATTKLEEKQESKYGHLDEYHRWLKRAFGGFQSHNHAVVVEPEIVEDEAPADLGEGGNPGPNRT